MSETRRSGRLVVALGVTAFVSFWIGASSAVPETKVETVTVTKYKTKKVEVPGPIQPLPQVCLDAVQLANNIAAYDPDLAEAAGNILDALQNTTRDAVVRDYESLNKSTQAVIISKNDLDITVNKRADLVLDLNSKLNQCNKAVGG